MDQDATWMDVAEGSNYEQNGLCSINVLFISSDNEHTTTTRPGTYTPACNISCCKLTLLELHPRFGARTDRSRCRSSRSSSCRSWPICCYVICCTGSVHYRSNPGNTSYVDRAGYYTVIHPATWVRSYKYRSGICLPCLADLYHELYCTTVVL